MVDKISIVIPAYIDTEEKNKWLIEAIKSAQNQTFDNTEIVVVDDCSPFPIKYDKTIRLDENVGTSIARNTAVHYATGNLILPLDYDDILMPNACELLYNSYEPDHFIYGNVTLLKNDTIGATTSFPKFQCENVLNLGGVFPVTCLHSKENHIKAGGWKPVLKHGLEDVEYWISMVRQCILGINIHKPILYYRKHPFSRTEKLRNENQEGKTKAIIRNIHKDLFSGGNMARCAGCGSSRRRQEPQKTTTSTNLLDYPNEVKMTIQYNGLRDGTFGVVGQITGVSYRIKGTGYKFEIHKNDWDRFKNIDAGKAFSIYTPPPPKQIEYNPSEPEIAAQPKIAYTLEQLDFNKNITQSLSEHGWTVEKIAEESRIGDLRKIAGIGPATEMRIMERAKSLFYK